MLEASVKSLGIDGKRTLSSFLLSSLPSSTNVSFLLDNYEPSCYRSFPHDVRCQYVDMSDDRNNDRIVCHNKYRRQQRWRYHLLPSPGTRMTNVTLTGTSGNMTLSMVYAGSSSIQTTKGIVLSGEIARTLLGGLCVSLEKTPDFQRNESLSSRAVSRRLQKWFVAVCCGPKVL